MTLANLMEKIAGDMNSLDIEHRVKELERRIEILEESHIKLQKENLIHMKFRETIRDEVERAIMEKIRSADLINLIQIETSDIYMLNKHIERLERKIEEIKTSDNPYSHLLSR